MECLALGSLEEARLSELVESLRASLGTPISQHWRPEVQSLCPWTQSRAPRLFLLIICWSFEVKPARATGSAVPVSISLDTAGRTWLPAG